MGCYILYLNKNVIEIWDSLPNNKFVAAIERDETTKKLLFAMEILFEKEKGALSNYKLEKANDILPQDNDKKEREDLALKLLTNDLNQEKQNLYDKARGRLYAKVEKQDGNERLHVGASETYIEAKYDD
ncbi:hypothetical protein K1719_016106 [Acacia pycnantha]|nr:hypothetical protein K1719_016106 [Acacia pycnantha]